MRRPLGRILGSIVGALALTILFGSSSPAQAIGVFPYAGDGDVVQCRSSDYSCTGGGYGNATARNSGWPWSNYGGSHPSYNSAGPHNCTLYAAYRLKQNGMASSPGWSANAGQWHVKFKDSDAKPAVGAIAEWFAGHVAYVESVNASGITITDDSFGNNITTRQTIAWNTKHWPNAFVHLKDRGSRWPNDPRNKIVGWRNPNGSITSWLVDGNGYRHWIPNTTIYWCLRNHGNADLGAQPADILNALPLSPSSATCR